MAKQILTSLDLLSLPSLTTPKTGSVGFGAKSDGLYQKIGAVESKLSTTEELLDRVKTAVPLNAKFTDTTYGVATTSANGLMSSADKAKLDGIAAGANNYSLPTASATVLGGIKVGSRLSISSGVLSANVQSDNNFTNAYKTKLDGIAAGANNYVHPSSHPISFITGLQDALDGKEPSFTKNTAFNKNFGTTAGTVAQGNDSRIINGQTAYSWGNHASAGYYNILNNTGYLTGYIDLNDVPAGVRGLARGTVDNIPSAGFNDVTTISQYGSNDLLQIVYPFRGDGKFYMRNKSSVTGQWSNWLKIWHSGNLTSLSQLTDNIGVASHIANKANPHAVTKAQVGLGNVDNVKQATKTEFDTHTGNTTVHITSTERTNWNDANSKKHTHGNKGVIDALTQGHINVLNKLSIDANGNLKIDTNAYATGELSAYGAGTGGGSGPSYERLDSWADYATGKEGWVLSALLGVDLNTRLSNVESGSATSITTTGSGNAITSVSKSGNLLTFNKGLTFSLSTHSHDAIYKPIGYVPSWSEITGKPSTFAPSSHTHTIANVTGLQGALDGKEPAFTKNTAFNKNFGTTAGTVAQGNDSRIINGQTAFGWGNHASEGYLKSLGNASEGYDLNDFNGVGVYGISSAIASSILNKPYSGSQTSSVTSIVGGNYGLQLYNVNSGGGKLYFRGRVSGAGNWGSWNEVWHSGNLTSLSQLTDNIGVGSHIANKANPHNVTKAQVGLGNVDNTADSAKNVLSATKLTTARTIAGVSFDGSANIAIPFVNLSSKPTTLAGYGISVSDVLTQLKTVDGAESGLDADLLDGLHKTAFAYADKKSYNSVVDDSGVDDWYSLFQVNDASFSPVICNIRAYAHTSVTFIVSKGYAANNGIISILNANTASTNGAYKYIKGVRVTGNGTVQIKLNAGASVSISAEILSSGSGIPSLFATLARETGTPTILDIVDPIINGSIRTKGLFSGDLSGNAATATKLATARTINGTSFNGSANITTANWGTARNIGVVNSDGTGTAVTTSVNGSANVNLKLPSTIKATLTGNASTATKLQTARTIAGVSFDGTANIAIPFANLSSKPTTLGGYGITDFTSHKNSNPINVANTEVNAIGYANNVSLFGRIDGGLLNMAYSSTWQSQIFQDFRTGQIALRGKNNGSWTSWRTVWDSENLTNLNQLTTRNFSDLQNKPTTLSGYGITDGALKSLTLTAGNGLTGGGTLEANRTFALGTPSTLTAVSTNAVTSTSHTHAITTTTVGAANTIVATDASGGVRGNIIRIGANWTLELSGTELVFKYNGVIKQRMLSDGSIVATGELTAYGATS